MRKRLLSAFLIVFASSSLSLNLANAKQSGDNPDAHASAPTDTTAAGDEQWLHFPSSLPEWTTRKQYKVGDTEFTVVRTDPAFSVEKADLLLNEALELAVRKSIDSHLDSGAGAMVDFTSEYILNKLLVDNHRLDHVPCVLDIEDKGNSQVYCSFAEIQIGPEFLMEAEARYSAYEKKQDEIRQRRLLIEIGLFGVGLLSVLAAMYSYLKLDHATRGFYTKRLQTLLILIMAIVVGTIAILTNWLVG